MSRRPAPKTTVVAKPDQTPAQQAKAAKIKKLNIICGVIIAVQVSLYLIKFPSDMPAFFPYLLNLPIVFATFIMMFLFYYQNTKD